MVGKKKLSDPNLGYINFNCNMTGAFIHFADIVTYLAYFGFLWMGMNPGSAEWLGAIVWLEASTLHASLRGDQTPENHRHAGDRGSSKTFFFLERGNNWAGFSGFHCSSKFICQWLISPFYEQTFHKPKIRATMLPVFYFTCICALLNNTRIAIVSFWKWVRPCFFSCVCTLPHSDFIRPKIKRPDTFFLCVFAGLSSTFAAFLFSSG